MITVLTYSLIIPARESKLIIYSLVLNRKVSLISVLSSLLNSFSSIEIERFVFISLAIILIIKLHIQRKKPVFALN